MFDLFDVVSKLPKYSYGHGLSWSWLSPFPNCPISYHDYDKGMSFGFDDAPRGVRVEPYLTSFDDAYSLVVESMTIGVDIDLTSSDYNTSKLRHKAFCHAAVLWYDMGYLGGKISQSVIDNWLSGKTVNPYNCTEVGTFSFSAKELASIIGLNNRSKQPPLTNRGVKPTIETLRQTENNINSNSDTESKKTIKPDWVAITYRFKFLPDMAQFHSMLSDYFGAISDIQSGKYFKGMFDKSCMFGGELICYWSESIRENSSPYYLVHLIASSQALAMLAMSKDIYGLVKTAHTFVSFGAAFNMDTYKISRFDVAIDDKTGGMTTSKVYDYTKRELFVSRFKREHIVYVSGLFNSSETLYFGKGKNSEKLFRFYNKAVEQGVDGVWHRCEMQLRGDNSTALFNQLFECVNEDDAVKIALGYLRHTLRFLDEKQGGDDSNKWRWGEADWWVNFCGNHEAFRVGVTRYEPNYDRTLAWLFDVSACFVALLKVGAATDKGLNILKGVINNGILKYFSNDSVKKRVDIVVTNKLMTMLGAVGSGFDSFEDLLSSWGLSPGSVPISYDLLPS